MATTTSSRRAKARSGRAQVLFAGAALVTDGGVEEIDAAFQTLAEDGPAVCLIQGPGVLAVVGIAEAHAPMQMRETRRSEFP